MAPEAKNDSKKMYVRGSVIASIPRFVQKKFGKKGYQQWLDAVSAETHNIYVLPIKDNEWYPLKEAIIQPAANIAQLFFNWNLKEAAWALGRFAVDSGLKTGYKVFVKMSSAASLIKKAGEFMGSAYKPAAAEVGEITEKTAILRITDFPEIDKTTEYHMSGWTQRILEINGLKSVRVETTRSLTNFQPCTEFLTSWD